MSRDQASQRALELAKLGRKLFFDPALSASGRMSCASCHSPDSAYGPSNSLAVQRGGVDLTQYGHRAAPSLRYLQAVPQFSEHHFDADATGDDSPDGGPTGGLTWDGRVDRTRDQARIPLLSPFESANSSPEAIVEAARRSAYREELARLAGSRSTEAVFETILDALEAWQQDYREFYPYSSKYDAWLEGKASLSEAEERGLRAFTDPEKGNCAGCHIATRGSTGSPPQFTDYAMVALGVPRNQEIPANSHGDWYDLGLCGPDRTDFTARPDYCGKFRTPSLRNVATRQVFFHNGAVHSLKDAVRFYSERDANPEKWYPRNNAGGVIRFDDLPARYWDNIETGAPFGRIPGSQPALNPQEIDDIVAFLGTLTDGFLH